MEFGLYEQRGFRHAYDNDVDQQFVHSTSEATRLRDCVITTARSYRSVSLWHTTALIKVGYSFTVALRSFISAEPCKKFFLYITSSQHVA